MSALVTQTATPLEKVPGLGEGLVEKLNAGGVTTVEALADMTPEQLEAIEGIGPKTVEKISLAVNNYFASLETGEAAPLGEETDATAGLTVEEPAPETAAEVDAAEFEDAEAPVEAAAASNRRNQKNRVVSLGRSSGRENNLHWITPGLAVEARLGETRTYNLRFRS